MHYWRTMIHELTQPKQSRAKRVPRTLKRYTFSNFSDQHYLTPKKLNVWTMPFKVIPLNRSVKS